MLRERGTERPETLSPPLQPPPNTLKTNRARKKRINKETQKQNCPGIIPGLSRPLPEISWEFCLCVSLFPQEKGKHINTLTPTHFRDNPAKLFMFIGFFAPRTKQEHKKKSFTPMLCPDFGWPQQVNWYCGDEHRPDNTIHDAAAHARTHRQET